MSDCTLPCNCKSPAKDCDGSCQAPQAKHWQPLLGVMIARQREAVPNRLYGATINHEGDAI